MVRLIISPFNVMPLKHLGELLVQQLDEGYKQLQIHSIQTS